MIQDLTCKILHGFSCKISLARSHMILELYQVRSHIDYFTRSCVVIQDLMNDHFLARSHNNLKSRSLSHDHSMANKMLSSKCYSEPAVTNSIPSAASLPASRHFWLNVAINLRWSWSGYLFCTQSKRTKFAIRQTC